MTLEVNKVQLGFDEIADMLVAENALAVSPSELHGLLAGQLASYAELTVEQWLASAVHLLDLENGFSDPLSERLLLALFQQTAEQLEHEALSFELVIPDDDTDIGFRVGALGRWSQGFLMGFGYQGTQTEQSLSEEAKDVLRDLSQISQVEDSVEEDEGAEADLFELQEYVRMAAVMMFTDCNMPEQEEGDAPESKPTVVH